MSQDNSQDDSPRPHSGLIGDAQGFLIGQRRISDGIGDVHADTQAIIAILQGDLSRYAQQQTQLVRYQTRALDRILQQLSRQPVIDVSGPPMRDVTPTNATPPTGAPTPDRTTQPTPTPLPPPGRPVVDDNGSNSQPSSTRQRRATADPSATVDTTTRQRDANGRFTSNGDANNNDDGLIGKLTESISHVQLMPPDTNGIDPTVDAVNELGRVLSPLGKVTGAVFGGIGRLFGRDGQQDIPRAQQRHNRRSERLMERLIDAVRGQGGGNGRVGLGGLGKAGVTGVLTTAALGAASMVVDQVNEWNDKNGNPIGELTAQVAAFLGNEEAKAAVEANKEPPPPPIVSDSPANMSWDERLLVLKSAFGSESARKEMREKYPENDAGYYGMPMGSKEVALAKQQKERQMQIYQAFKQAKFSDEQAKALTAEVGRENNYRDKFLFGTHGDAANNATNMGMLSWQLDRKENLVKFMKSKGLVEPDGTFKKGQDSLNAQALFAKQEIESGRYEKTRKFFEQNPNATAEQMAPVLGTNYVGWAYGQDVLKSGQKFDWKSHDRKRSGNLAVLNQQLSGKNNSRSAESSASNAKGAPIKQGEVPPLLRRPTIDPPKKPATVPPVPKSKVTSQQLSPKIPDAPKPKPMPASKAETKTVNSPKTEMVAVYTSPDSISQNVGDRGLAHALTGGIGMADRFLS